MLFVFYNNTNIDVINTNGDITNVADIKRKVITGKKTINEVFFDGKELRITGFPKKEWRDEVMRWRRRVEQARAANQTE